VIDRPVPAISVGDVPQHVDSEYDDPGITLNPSTTDYHEMDTTAHSSVLGHPFQRWLWNGMLNRDNFTFFLGCLAVLVVDRESYGSDRCSVLVITGVFNVNFFYLSLFAHGATGTQAPIFVSFLSCPV
jgi:hypothetical protein